MREIGRWVLNEAPWLRETVDTEQAPVVLFGSDGDIKALIISLLRPRQLPGLGYV